MVEINKKGKQTPLLFAGSLEKVRLSLRIVIK